VSKFHNWLEAVFIIVAGFVQILQQLIATTLSGLSPIPLSRLRSGFCSLFENGPNILQSNQKLVPSVAEIIMLQAVEIGGGSLGKLQSAFSFNNCSNIHRLFP